MIDAVLRAGVLEGVCPEDLSAFHGRLDERGGGRCVAWCREVDAVVSENRMDLVGHSPDEGAQEVAGNLRRGLLVQFHIGELARAIDGNEQVELALFGAHLRDIDVKIADRVSLELALAGHVAGDFWQARDAMALQAAMQARAGQMRDGGLERIEAVIQRQQGVFAEGHKDRLFLSREHR